MIDLSGVTHHRVVEDMVDVLCAKTQNVDRTFFRVEVAYFLAKMASSQRAVISTKDRGEIPVNMYALNLATSGYGKGHSVHIVENEFLAGFRKRFMEDTFPVISEKHLWVIANDRALKNGTDQQEEFDKVEAEWKRAGALPFTFDSATGPAVKQLRHKLVLSDCGALNLQVDEVGTNLAAALEPLALYLELYDQGLIKPKLVKNTAENQRNEDMEGKTPANLLLFGTPAKLFDGGQTEDAFYSLLDTGYARRCLFGVGTADKKAYISKSAAEIYNDLINPKNNDMVDKWAAHFHSLADPSIYGWKMKVEDDVGIALVEYQIQCRKAAEAMKEHEEIRKAEMEHRYFKALKLAGCYAFVDQSNEIEMSHLLQALLLVEESGQSFTKILTREKSHVRLANYICDMETELTQADLLDALAFYPKAIGPRNDMMTLATAYGYTRHMLIKKRFVDGIEFFRGEKLQETDLNKLILSYSQHWAYDYGVEPEGVPFDQLETLCKADGVHWANHAFKNQHRAAENIITGFNMIVIDVDSGTPLHIAHSLLREYKFATYTTKRHQTEGHGDRYRIIIPMNYTLHLDREDYKQFMNNVLAWLPFPAPTDEGANQPERKWESCATGEFYLNNAAHPDGLEPELLDVLPFIPRTSVNDKHIESQKELASLDNLERWFAQRMATGSRNNQMIKFALALVDGGLGLLDVERAVKGFNAKLSDPLDEDELDSTVMVTVSKKYIAK